MNVTADGGVEREVGGKIGGELTWSCLAVGWWGGFVGQMEGQGEIGGTENAGAGIEDGGFEDGGKFADVSRPGMLEQAGKGSGSENCGGLLVASADAVNEGLGNGGDVFAVFAEGRDGKADGGETKGQVGQKKPLAGQMAQGGVAGDEQKESRRGAGAALKDLDEIEKQVLAGDGEQIDAVEIQDAVEGVGLVGQPFAGVAAAKGMGGKFRLAVNVLGEEMLAGSGFALEGGQVQAGSSDFGLEQEAAESRADTDKGGESGIFETDDAGSGRVLRVVMRRRG